MIRLKNSLEKNFITNKNICEEMNTKSQCVFALEDTYVPSLPQREWGHNPENNKMKYLEVRGILKELGPHTSREPDDISRVVLKDFE